MSVPIINLELEGFERLKGVLSVLDEKVQKRLMRAALKKGAYVILNETQQHVPVDTGKLLKSLDVKSMKRSRKKTSFGFMVQTGTREELGIDPEDKGYYPMTIEFGSSNSKSFSAKTAGKRIVEKRPFMRLGLRRSKDEAIRVIGTDLERGIKRTLKSLVKKSRTKK